MVAQHPGHIEIFDDEPIVGVDQLVGNLVQEMAARMGVVTGKGLSDLIRENFGVRITFWSMLLLLVANIATTVAEFAGIAGAMDIFGVSPFIAVPVAAVAVWVLR